MCRNIKTTNNRMNSFFYLIGGNVSNETGARYEIRTRNATLGRLSVTITLILQDTPIKGVKNYKHLLFQSIYSLSIYNFVVVEMTGFEPATFWSQTRCATKLRYISRLFRVRRNRTSNAHILHRIITKHPI